MSIEHQPEAPREPSPLEELRDSIITFGDKHASATIEGDRVIVHFFGAVDENLATFTNGLDRLGHDIEYTVLERKPSPEYGDEWPVAVIEVKIKNGTNTD